MRPNHSFRTSSFTSRNPAPKREKDPLERRATYSFASASMTRFQDISKHYAQSFDEDDDNNNNDATHKYPRKQVEHEEEEEDDDDDSRHSGDELNEDDEITRSEILEEIEEALERAKKELVLYHLSLDVVAVDFLIQKVWRERRSNQHSIQGIEKVELDACSFADPSAAVGLIRFLQMLGPNLKEVFLIDTFTHTNDYLLDERAVSLLRGLSHVPTLERLAVDKAHLKGRSVGMLLQHVLLQASHLQVLRFHDCHVDDAMLHPFCQGLQYHPIGLRHLDLEAWYLDDSQLALIVQALVKSKSRHTLQYFDISKSDLTMLSLPTVALFVQHMRALTELVLQDAPHLWAHVTPSTPGLQTLVAALRSATQIKELRLGESPHLTDTLAAVLLDATYSHQNLHALHMGDNLCFVRDNNKDTTDPAQPQPQGPPHQVDEDNDHPKGAFLSTPTKSASFRGAGGDFEARFVV